MPAFAQQHPTAPLGTAPSAAQFRRSQQVLADILEYSHNRIVLCYHTAALCCQYRHCSTHGCPVGCPAALAIPGVSARVCTCWSHALNPADRSSSSDADSFMEGEDSDEEGRASEDDGDMEHEVTTNE